MRVRWWPAHFSSEVASTRIRALPTIGALRRMGLDAELYRQEDSVPHVLVLGKRYDTGSIRLARALRDLGTVVVLDLCDNHFYADPQTVESESRGQRLREAIRSVDAVVASTPTLAAMISAECPQAPPITVIGDAVESPSDASTVSWASHPLDEWRLYRHRASLVSDAGRPTRLVWFGHHGSEFAAGGMYDLRRIALILRQVSEEFPLCLSIISNHRAKFEQLRSELGIQCHYLPWSIHSFSRAMRLHDIALIPVGINPFTACKTNNRLATALQHGLAVAADPVPSYLEFADAAELGDWEGGLRRLCSDPSYRQQLISLGRERLLRDWSINTIANQWMTFLKRVAGQQ